MCPVSVLDDFKNWNRYRWRLRWRSPKDITFFVLISHSSINSSVWTPGTFESLKFLFHRFSKYALSCSGCLGLKPAVEYHSCCVARVDSSTYIGAAVAGGGSDKALWIGCSSSIDPSSPFLLFGVDGSKSSKNPHSSADTESTECALHILVGVPWSCLRLEFTLPIGECAMGDKSPISYSTDPSSLVLIVCFLSWFKLF